MTSGRLSRFGQGKIPPQILIHREGAAGKIVGRSKDLAVD